MGFVSPAGSGRKPQGNLKHHRQNQQLKWEVILFFGFFIWDEEAHTCNRYTEKKKLFGSYGWGEGTLEKPKKIRSLPEEDRDFKSSEESSSPTLWWLGSRTDGMVDWSTKAM